MRNLLNIQFCCTRFFACYVWMICAILYWNFDEIRWVCMNYVWCVEMRIEMYAGSIRWPAPASMSADWSLCLGTNRRANLRVGVRDALSSHATIYVYWVECVFFYHVACISRFIFVSFAFHWFLHFFLDFHLFCFYSFWFVYFPVFNWFFLFCFFLSSVFFYIFYF